MKKKILGIYFGVDNVCMATYDAEGHCFIVPNRNNSKTTPAFVGFSKNGKILIGEEAKKQGIINIERTVSSLRSLTGREYRKEVGGITYTLVQILAIFFKELKADAEKYMNVSFDAVLVVVPEYCSKLSRDEIAEGLSLAGFGEVFFENIERILSFQYYFNTKETIIENGKLKKYIIERNSVGEEDILLCIAEKMIVRLIALRLNVTSSTNVKASILKKSTFGVQPRESNIQEYINTLGINPLPELDYLCACRFFNCAAGIYTIQLAQEFNITSLLTIQRIYNEVEAIQEKLGGDENKQERLYIPYAESDSNGPIHIDKTVSAKILLSCVPQFEKELRSAVNEVLCSSEMKDKKFISIEYGGDVPAIMDRPISEGCSEAVAEYTHSLCPTDFFEPLTIEIARTAYRMKKYHKLKKVPATIWVSSDAMVKPFPIIKRGEVLPIKGRQLCIGVPNQSDSFFAVFNVDGKSDRIGALSFKGLEPINNPIVHKGVAYKNVYVTLDLDEDGKIKIVACSFSGMQVEAEFGI